MASSLIHAIVLGLVITTEANPPPQTSNNLLDTDFECPENWGYYEDQENCIKYYRCEFRAPENIVCRSGKLFAKKILSF